ncbi:MAG TPA: hypothetical protein VEF04_17410 [Blastocatellia bacterium]|nr:hypothetical protein [Blastocatellia bacterium]
MVVVQHIETTWYKNERGAMHGTLRGKTPEAVLIPIDGIIAEDDATVVHTIRYARTTDQIQENIKIRTGKNLHIDCLHVEHSDKVAVVEFTWNYRTGGRSIRWQMGRKSWTLNNNEWCRIRYNERSILEHTWKYKITTINIGVFDKVTRDCFKKTNPDYYFEDLGQLR